MTLPIADIRWPAVLSGHRNGYLPDRILVTVPGLAGGPDVRLVEPAARAWRAWTAAAAAQGHTLKATSRVDSYRPFSVQDTVYRQRYTWDGKRWVHTSGAPAAFPGTSNHGWGLAVDIGQESDRNQATVEPIGDAAVRYLARTAAAYGWSAERQDERWHWRYVAGDNIPAAVLAHESSSPADRITGPIVTAATATAAAAMPTAPTAALTADPAVDPGWRDLVPVPPFWGWLTGGADVAGGTIGNVRTGLNGIVDALSASAHGALQVGKLAQLFTRLWLPSNIVRGVSAILGVIFVLIGIWFLAREVRQSTP